eukprot:4182-Rhodomonas_salina.2
MPQRWPTLPRWSRSRSGPARSGECVRGDMGVLCAVGGGACALFQRLDACVWLLWSSRGPCGVCEGVVHTLACPTRRTRVKAGGML